MFSDSASVILNCFRRFMWNLFRLENEQINNNNAMRAVQVEREVSAVSLELSDEQHMKELLRMMDSYDGVAKVRPAPSTQPSMQRIRATISASRKSVFLDSRRSELFTKISSVE